MRERGEHVMPRRYARWQVRLIVSSPPDGSQDFYVSVMVGMPLPMVAVERARLMGAAHERGRLR